MFDNDIKTVTFYFVNRILYYWKIKMAELDLNMFYELKCLSYERRTYIWGQIQFKIFTVFSEIHLRVKYYDTKQLK